ncbi:4-hydroxy-tetrahydrodipicolinate reductase [Bacillaceae bacterium SIJ1]|uniref:4-hydroxy-tetrahydrodipicolinate reductase n=1 Tax=Litoribacterium kuwaitense TaxID=1398745 RepID=UPI0013EB70FD|nr:4-hydroxy-tetrahydrodipicolinate reductase [Litoribacterium kuwaitense]NGP43730.1 4-hydroxy-tetrahydrodipicolinate reductase [Litoribacterium kuwaitense]
MEQIKIIVAGPRGKMGREALQLIERTAHFSLVAAIDRTHDGETVRDVTNIPLDAMIYTDAEQCLNNVDADVLIDLTIPEAGKRHAKMALEAGVSPVIGTSGFSQHDIAQLTELAEAKETGCIIAPNFALGAVLMMKFAKTAAKYMPDVEIIEKHHDQKLDAPSGTAVKTAEMIRDVREQKHQGHEDEKEILPGARGADVDGMKVHSMRLPGLVAHQQVIFGSNGETLTIQHDSIHRVSFMSGVQLAVETVQSLNTLVYGLDELID